MWWEQGLCDDGLRVWQHDRPLGPHTYQVNHEQEPRDSGPRDIKLSLITNIESQSGGSQEIIHIHSKYYLQLCELDRKINMLTEKAVSTQICLDLCCLSLWRRLVDWLKSTRTKNGGNLKWAHESGLSAPWKSRMTIVSAKQILASPNIFGLMSPWSPSLKPILPLLQVQGIDRDYRLLSQPAVPWQKGQDLQLQHQHCIVRYPPCPQDLGCHFWFQKRN